MKEMSNREMMSALYCIRSQISDADKQIIDEAMRRISYLHIKGIEAKEMKERLGY